jgi:hypothetical protein
MKLKYVVYAALTAVCLLGYNAFLIQRDQRMYDAYYCKTIGCANER